MNGPFNVGGGSSGGGGSAEAITYDNSKSHIKATNTQDAIDAVLGVTLPSLTVKVTAGSAISITDGATTITGTADSDGSFTTMIPNTGKWTATATLDGESTDGSVDVTTPGAAYTLELAYFAATITVTAEAGAAVTATSGSNVYSGTAGTNGKAAITVKRAGTYSITAAKDGAASNSVNVSATTNGGSYTATVAFLKLTVTAPSGSSLTVKNGSTTLMGTTIGASTFYLPNTGTWTVTASKDGETATDTVNCSAYQTYTVELAFVKIYSVTWDKSSKTVLSRGGDAALFTDPVPQVNGKGGSSPFDNLQPWAGMVKSTDSEAGVLVSIPKYWFRWTETSSTLTLEVADKAVSGFHTSPGHADCGDGKGERDVVYIGRYKCANGTYKSETGKTPQANVTRANFRTNIHNLGSTIWQQDFAMFWTWRMLFLVEYATWDGQAAIGYNCGNNSGVENMGKTDSMTYHTGTVAASLTTYGTGVQYRYIEDPWGNVYEWVDGIYFSGADIYIILNPANFSDTTGGTKTGTRPTKSGWISAWGIPTVSGYEFALYPSAVDGADGQYVPDYCSYDASGVVLFVGGVYDQIANLGPFFLSGYSAASYQNVYRGSRLQKKP